MRVFVSMPKGKETDTFLTQDARKYLEERFETVYSSYDRHLTAEEFAAQIKGFDAVITGWSHVRITAPMLDGSGIKVIAHTGGSVGDLIDPGVYEKTKVRVLSGNLLYAESVAEGVIAYMLTGLRRIPYYVQDIKNGGWRGDGFFSEGLLDQTVGIIGMGAISRILIPMLQTFRAKIKIYSSYPIDEAFLKENHATQAKSLEEIFSSCNIVSLHSAKNKKTEGMIRKSHFDLMKEGALFVNTARGAIVNEEEMIAALKEKKIHAVLDVFCKEPLDKDSELRTMEHVYCIPHMGGPTMDRRGYVTMKLADNLEQFVRGDKMELEITAEAAKRMTVEK